MVKEFWHNLITEKSFGLLQNLRKQFDFVLIGGWAVYLYTQSLKSKDIDMIVELETLGELKKIFNVSKNNRLKKYEIKTEGIDIDIYIPFWSNLGLSVTQIIQNTISLEGFKVPQKEILLILKLFAYNQRKASLKGEKDMLDIVSLLRTGAFNAQLFRTIFQNNNLSYLEQELKDILNSRVQIKELDMNSKQFSDFKKRILAQLDISS
jgi:hypothetical protein